MIAKHLVRPFATGIGCLALGACVNPSAKIASGLTRYGLGQSDAQCVGDRLEANLSTRQLQQLGRAARARKEGNSTPGRLTLTDLLRASSQFQDVRVPLELAKAAAGCGVLPVGAPAP